MMKQVMVFLIFALAVVSQAQDDTEHPQINVASQEFQKSLSSSVDMLSRAGFENGLESPGFGAMSDDQFQTLVSTIRMETFIPEISEGQVGVKYDVILQPGHYGRPPAVGNVGTSGQLVSERALAAYITNVIARNLRDRHHLSVLVVSADGYLRPSSKSPFNGLNAKVFLAIHLDGNATPCSGHASLAYQRGALPFGMHAVGWSLSQALGYSYRDFAMDNYTPNEAGYYMFSQVHAD